MRASMRLSPPIVGGILDEGQAFFAAAPESGGVGHPPHRQRHGRDQVSVGADDQAGIAAALVELHHALVGAVGFAGRSERRAHTALDRRRERRAQPDRRAELVIRVRVARVRRDLLARESIDRPVIASNSFSSSGGRRRQLDVRARHAAEIAVDGHRAAPERLARARARRQDPAAPRRRRDRPRRPRGKWRSRVHGRGCRALTRRGRGASPTAGLLRPRPERRRWRQSAAASARDVTAHTSSLRPAGGCAACAFCIQSHPATKESPGFLEGKGVGVDKVSTVETHGHAHGHAHDHAHEELGFWRKYVFSQDHKVIGIQYAITALLFLFFGFCLMMLMRWQLAYPGQADSAHRRAVRRRRMRPAASCCPSSTTSSARCTARSWSSSASCRSPSAASATSSCRCRSARPTWPSPSST